MIRGSGKVLCRDPRPNENTLHKGPEMSNNVSRVTRSSATPENKCYEYFQNCVSVIYYLYSCKRQLFNTTVITIENYQTQVTAEPSHIRPVQAVGRSCIKSLRPRAFVALLPCHWVRKTINRSNIEQGSTTRLYKSNLPH